MAWSGHAGLLAASLLWGTSFVAGKIALETMAAPWVVLLRFLCASAFWAPVAWRSWPLLRQGLGRADWGALAWQSFLMIPATFLLQFVGLQHTSASSATVMIGLEPLLFVLVGWLFKGETLHARDLGLASVAFVGVLLVLGWPEDAGFVGCLLVLLSALVVAFWVRQSKPWMSRLGVNTFTAWTTCLGTMTLLPWVWVWPSGPIGLDRLSPSGIAALLYLGLGCSVAAGWCWNQGVARSPAQVGGLFLALEPVFGIGLAAGLLQEQPSPRVWVGALLVIAPVLWSAVQQNHPGPDPNAAAPAAPQARPTPPT